MNPLRCVMASDSAGLFLLEWGALKCRAPMGGAGGGNAWLWIGRGGGCRMLLFDDEIVYGLIVIMRSGRFGHSSFNASEA